MMLSDVVAVARRFQRSIRIDTDLPSGGALEGFICNASSRMALETMARAMLDSEQRAFTWTGPYGGGKSSLALALAAFVDANPERRKSAERLLGGVDSLRDAFPVRKDGWLVLPVMGRRADPVADLDAALSASLPSDTPASQESEARAGASGRDLIARLQAEAEARPKSGVLVVIDEMGKFLEGAADEGTDVHFFQELAEAAGRTQGRLVVVGILHQAFEQYAARLGHEARNEWAKVQGRYIDIPLITAIDEVIDLLGQAVLAEHSHPGSQRVAEAVAKAITRRRPGSSPDLAERLDRCWPLHPVSAALLGPVSRRRFGQNERSTFGFLNSGEPEGFQDFLRSTAVADLATFEPARLWDYLRINLEPAILASPDGHRWAQAVEAVERTEARGGPVHVRLAKSVAVIELFRNGSGLVPESDVLAASLPDVPEKEVERTLEELKGWSVLVFRKHLDAWGVYAGSDFDIEQAVAEARAATGTLDLPRLAKLAGLQPLLAKQHYHRTGTLRWFETELRPLTGLKEAVSEYAPRDGAAGKFILVIPDTGGQRKSVRDACRAASSEAGAYPVAVGLPHNAWLICEYGAELLALEMVQTSRPELEGDAVARREVRARIAAISAELEEALRSALAGALWYVRGVSHNPADTQGLSRLVTDLANTTFDQAPEIHSELINRDKPSSNIQGAIRQLLYAMAEHEDRPYLGIEGFPAERGLYSTVLEVSGLHRCRKDGTYSFRAPTSQGRGTGKSFRAMWKAADTILADAGDTPASLARLYETWSAPPYGLKRGVLPVLAMAYVLANRSSLAVYAEGTFRPEFDRYLVDLLLQGEHMIALRPVNLAGKKTRLLEDLTAATERVTGTRPANEPLAVARALVRFVFQLPAWTRKTTSLSADALAVRKVLLTASDPYRALFIDLPIHFEGLADGELGLAFERALLELGEAYPRMLQSLRERMLDALSHQQDDFGSLRERAGVVTGLSGDLRLDAFATRLADFDGSTEAMEGVASMAINKPPREWSDRDPDRAALALADLALRFRQAELLARVKGRAPTQHALAIAFGTGEAGCTLMESFDISEAERSQASNLARELIHVLKGSGADRRLVLAALAEAGIDALGEEDQPFTDEPDALRKAAS